MEKLEIKGSKKFWLFHFLGSLGLSAGGALMIAKGKDPLTAWGATLFFAGCAAVGFWQLLDSRPRLSIDEKGILHPPWGIGLLRWQDIRDLQLNEINYQKFLCLWVHDPKRYFKPRHALRRQLIALNQKLGYGDLALMVSGLELSAEEVLVLCHKLKSKAG